MDKVGENRSGAWDRGQVPSLPASCARTAANSETIDIVKAE